MLFSAASKRAFCDAQRILLFHEQRVLHPQLAIGDRDRGVCSSKVAGGLLQFLGGPANLRVGADQQAIVPGQNAAEHKAAKNQAEGDVGEPLVQLRQGHVIRRHQIGIVAVGLGRQAYYVRLKRARGSPEPARPRDRRRRWGRSASISPTAALKSATVRARSGAIRVNRRNSPCSRIARRL